MTYAKRLITLRDRPVEMKYKDNSAKEYIPDKSLPMCVVCYTHNAGRGKIIYKLCRHGKDLCITCAKQCTLCPVCRSPKS